MIDITHLSLLYLCLETMQKFLDAMGSAFTSLAPFTLGRKFTLNLLFLYWVSRYFVIFFTKFLNSIRNFVIKNCLQQIVFSNTRPQHGRQARQHQGSHHDEQSIYLLSLLYGLIIRVFFRNRQHRIIWSGDHPEVKNHFSSATTIVPIVPFLFSYNNNSFVFYLPNRFFFFFLN